MEARVKGQIALMECLPNSEDVYALEELVWEKSKNDPQTYIRFIYNIISRIIQNQPLDSIVMTTQYSRLGWNDECFDDAREQVQEHDDFLENPFTVEEGALVCSCGSNKVFSYQKMTRAADEPMTTFACCTKCRKKWAYSG